MENKEKYKKALVKINELCDQMDKECPTGQWDCCGDFRCDCKTKHLWEKINSELGYPDILRAEPEEVLSDMEDAINKYKYLIDELEKLCNELEKHNLLNLNNEI